MDKVPFSVFNTNNELGDLCASNKILADGSFRFPAIQSAKRVSGEKVIQLETAMGAVVSAFERAVGLKVKRDRFLAT